MLVSLAWQYTDCSNTNKVLWIFFYLCIIGLQKAFGIWTGLFHDVAITIGKTNRFFSITFFLKYIFYSNFKYKIPDIQLSDGRKEKGTFPWYFLQN